MSKLPEFYPNDPITLTLTSDFRFCQTNPLYDYVWDLLIGKGEPAAVSCYSTFGLRAKEFKMFPRFIEEDVAIINPADFKRPITINTLLPNLIRMNFSPLQGINVHMALYVPDSSGLSIHLSFKNNHLEDRRISLDWVTMLSAGADGHRMKEYEDNNAQYLQGKTDHLTPMVFMSGVTKQGSGSLPALTQEFTLPSGLSSSVIIHFAALPGVEKTISLIEKLRNSTWEHEIARIDGINQSLIHISTGNLDYNKVLYCGQLTALQQIIRLGNDPEMTTVVGQRSSLSNFIKNSQNDEEINIPLVSSWDLNHLASMILPLEPEVIANIISKYIENQESNGRIQIPLSIQDGSFASHCTPILAKLSLDYYHQTKDVKFLQKVFTPLLDYFHHWFDPVNDPDQDGIPNVGSPLQLGLDNHPLFIPYHTSFTPIDPSLVESPALCSLLYSEGQHLIQISNILEQTSPITPINTIIDQMQSAITASWSKSDSLFHYWDIDSHESPQGSIFTQIEGAGEHSLDYQINQSTRIGFRLIAKDSRPREFKIFLKGTNRSGDSRIVGLTNNDFSWKENIAITITKGIFQSISEIEVYDINTEDRVQIFIPDYQFADISLLSPLALPNLNHSIQEKLIANSVLNPERFWGNFGIKTYIAEDNANIQASNGLNLPWNQFLGEILVDLGHRTKAWDLFKRILSPMIHSLKQSHQFYSSYHHESGDIYGLPGTLASIPPLHLFLKIIGIEMLSREEIILNGFNPTPWEISINYQGIVIYASQSKYTIKFPGGQTVVVRNPQMRSVRLSYLESSP